MRDRQTCIGCGKKSPETETNYTLISAQFGWRLTRYRNPDGTIVIEWRCPACWRDYKKAKGGDIPGSSTPDSRDGRETPTTRSSVPDPLEAAARSPSTRSPLPPRPTPVGAPAAPKVPSSAPRVAREGARSSAPPATPAPPKTTRR